MLFYTFTVTTLTTPTSTPDKELVDFDVSLDLHIPFSSAQADLLGEFRRALKNQPFPANISQYLEVTKLFFTTACSPNSTSGLLCNCEDDFAWPCDKCNNSNSCNDVSSKTCTCIYGLPSDNKFCQPITNDSICPTVTP
ncbi:hypothetical protein ILYODFUR_021248, partial [Ilyodon furcidens]